MPYFVVGVLITSVRFWDKKHSITCVCDSIISLLSLVRSYPPASWSHLRACIAGSLHQIWVSGVHARSSTSDRAFCNAAGTQLTQVYRWCWSVHPRSDAEGPGSTTGSGDVGWSWGRNLWTNFAFSSSRRLPPKFRFCASACCTQTDYATV